MTGFGDLMDDWCGWMRCCLVGYSNVKEMAAKPDLTVYRSSTCDHGMYALNRSWKSHLCSAVRVTLSA